MADLAYLLTQNSTVRTAARGTVSDMPRLVVSCSGGTSFQTLPQTFTTVQFNTVSVDNKNAWNAANNTWTVPETGTYEVNGKLRLVDGNLSGLSYGLGIDVVNEDNAGFFWGVGAPNRQGLFNSRIIMLTAGQALRLYAYVDNPSGVGVNAAELNAVRIA